MLLFKVFNLILDRLKEIGLCLSQDFQDDEIRKTVSQMFVSTLGLVKWIKRK